MKNKLINKTDLFEKFMVLVGVGVGVFILFFLLISTWIGYEVDQRCKRASLLYSEECIAALEKTVDDEGQPFGDRNSAIWTLGQLGDAKALPTLEKHYTGDIPDREPWDSTLSQYEMKKAINLLKGGKNITSFVWRRGIK